MAALIQSFARGQRLYILAVILGLLFAPLTYGRTTPAQLKKETFLTPAVVDYTQPTSSTESCNGLFCAADPVNNVDPSGHFMEGTGGLLLTTALQKGLRGLQATSMTVPGHIAARGFMRWAWLAGGIGAGVQTLMQDTQFAMDMQLMMMSNPTGSKWAYENLRCVEFAADAMAYFRANTQRRGQPERITYDMNPGMGPGFIMAKENFGFLGGQVISHNGHHEGVLHDRRVYDNNVPFGVSRTRWEESYELFINGQGEMSIGESARKGFGVIKVE